MKNFALVFLLLVAAMSLGCYHATIVTGSSPGNVIIDKPWAHGFLFGLVPPSTVETAAQCPGGVAKVETEQTVPNWLATVITFGIYTPWHIKVTCAAQAVSLNGEIEYLLPDVDLTVREDASPREVAEVLQAAAELAFESKEPVFVKFLANQP